MNCGQNSVRARWKTKDERASEGGKQGKRASDAKEREREEYVYPVSFTADWRASLQLIRNRLSFERFSIDRLPAAKAEG